MGGSLMPSVLSPLLGCATEYRVEVYLIQRVDNLDEPLPVPQMRYIGVLEGITGITWTRRLRDFSQADITLDFITASPDCCRMFQIIADSVRVAQLRIWRDDIQVWEGEVMQASETTGSTIKTIVARDMVQRLDDTVNNLTLNYVDTPVTDIAYDIIERNLLNAAFSDPLDDTLILDQIVVEAVTDPDDTISYRPGAKVATVGELLRILGQSYGLDFTTINRSIRLQRRRTTQDQTYARLNTEHLIGEAEARSNGLAAATRGWATTQAEDATQPKSGEVDPDWPGITQNFGVTGTRYGRIDILNRVQDNQADAGDVLSSAKRAVWGRNPPPSEILLPTTAQLSPSAPLTMPELVPGMRIDFFAEDGLCRPIRQGMRLLAVEVTWTPAGANTNQGEEVAVELSTLSDVTGVEP
jgi:hypothetical protein